MRQKFFEFIKERSIREGQDKTLKIKEDLLEKKLLRMKSDAVYRLQLIEEFKLTLEKIEWDEKLKEDEKHKRMKYHAEFINKLNNDKIFKQEMYAAERLME